MKAMPYLLFTVLTIITSYSCNNPTEMPPIDEIPAGSRNYEWTIDTLFVDEGRSRPSGMWGTNANIWAVGGSYSTRYAIWHWNGVSWMNYIPYQFLDPFAIFGFASDDIWIGSLDGTFWHFDGRVWGRIAELKIPNFQTFKICGISGSATNDIYAVGFADSSDGQSFKAVIAHYNGKKWELVNIPSLAYGFNQIFYDKNSSEYLIQAWNSQTNEYALFNFDGINLKKIYSTNSHITINEGWGRLFINIIMDRTIYIYEDSQLKVFKDLSGSQYAGRLYGNSEKDFFTINWDGIGHYNGTDLITIFKCWNQDLFSIAGIVTGKEAFFIYDDLYYTLIIHGKLNK